MYYYINVELHEVDDDGKDETLAYTMGYNSLTEEIARVMFEPMCNNLTYPVKLYVE